MPKADRMQGVEVVRKPSRRRPAILDMDHEAIRAEARRSMSGLPSLSPPAEVLPPGPRELLSGEDFEKEINRLWERANQHFVDIGRRLNEAKGRLRHGEFMAMVRSRLPFGQGVANKLMKVAEVIDSKETPVPIESLPPHYTTIYDIITLPKDAIDKALSAGVINPNMRRGDLSKFKTQRQAPRNEAFALRKEIARLERLLDEKRDRLAEIECRGSL